MLEQSFIERFNLKWKINTVTGCWDWTASVAGKGYGQIKLPRQRKQEYAHRLAYLIHKGEIPEGKHVCHTCDNPLCVNPAHLWLGSSAENQQDMKQKGRSLYGERNPYAILTEDGVRKIRQLLEQELSQAKIGRIVGISQIEVSRIKRGLRWAHVR